jgi:hypothetical protein
MLSEDERELDEEIDFDDDLEEDLEDEEEDQNANGERHYCNELFVKRLYLM